MDPDVNLPSCDNVNKTDTKICGVCGDRALGYNFNAVTCESCKAFFRRNALKNKEFQCPFSDNCEITVVTRRFCQRCRLEKCLAIGMRKDYIMSEEDKVMKREKIEQNRAKKRPKFRHENDESRESVDQEKNASEQADIDDVPPRKVKSWSSGESINASEETECFHSVSPRASVVTMPGSHPQVADSYPSPASAGSFSSPSSPHDSASVGVSKTLESFSENGSSRIGTVCVITNSHSSVSEVGNTLSPSISGYPSHLKDKEFGAGSSRDLPLLSSLVLNHKMEDGITRLQQPPPPPPLAPPSVPAPLPDSASCWGNVSSPSDACWANGTVAQEDPVRNTAALEILQDVKRIPIAPNSIESILSEAIKLEFEAYSSLAKSHQNSRKLNDAEQAKLNELIVANKALHDPLDDDLSALVGEDFRFKSNADHSPVLLDVINLTAIAIRRLIKTSKKINAFKNMCQEDQIALLKGGSTEMLILRSAMSYDPNNQVWKIPHSQDLNVKVDVLKEARGNIYEEHQRFLRTFDPRWRTDENIMLILSAITLFTPDRPRVVHHDVIKLEQNTYYYLLRRYLESVYPGCEARSTFLKLIQKIAELHRLNDEHVQVYLDANPRDVEPLLIEIFDLKPH